MGEYEVQWAQAFALTLAIEAPVYLWLLCKQGFPAACALGLAIGVNAISHPLLWFALPRFEPYLAFAATGEAMVLAIEASVIIAWSIAIGPRLRWTSIAGVVVFANVASMGAGLLL